MSADDDRGDEDDAYRVIHAVDDETAQAYERLTNDRQDDYR